MNFTQIFQIFVLYNKYKERARNFVEKAEKIAAIANQSDLTKFVKELRDIYNKLP